MLEMLNRRLFILTGLLLPGGAGHTSGERGGRERDDTDQEGSGHSAFLKALRC